MKLYFLLHETSELQTDLAPDAATERLSAVTGTKFRGTQQDGCFQLTRNDRNLFRPELNVRLLPEGEGTLVTAEMKLHPAMLGFLLVWTLVFIGLAIWKAVLMLVLLPVIWLVVIWLFSKGVQNAREALTEVLDAFEIIG